MTDDDLLRLLHETADAVADALARVDDWGPSGEREGQYAADLHADEAALNVLRRAGVGILSEESGLEGADRDLVVIIDPLDGSTNASRGVPWFATALCVVDAEGPRVGLVAHQAGGPRYWGVRGGGAWCNGRAVRPSGCTELGSAIVGVNGVPPRHPGWAQFRALGASALDFCLVADGVLDGYIDWVGATPDGSAHGVWDYAASWLICREVGVVLGDAFDRELIVRDHRARRAPIVAATSELFEQLSAARRAG
jgi:fructose-1,6-bisphosphatase/inositol monophosphatase family enzyme